MLLSSQCSVCQLGDPGEGCRAPLGLTEKMVQGALLLLLSALNSLVSIRLLSSPCCLSQSVFSDTSEWNIPGVVYDIQNALFPTGGQFSYPLANVGRVQNLGVAAAGDPG